MNRKIKGKVILGLGLLTLFLKLMEPFIVTTGCFGYDYIYEIMSFAIPIILIIVGVKLIK